MKRDGRLTAYRKSANLRRTYFLESEVLAINTVETRPAAERQEQTDAA